MNERTLLVSDVDGTLLDRSGQYAMTPVEIAPALEKLTIVLASSRTVLELSRNQRDLGIEGPVIAENGAVVALPWAHALASIGPREIIGGRTWCLIERGSGAQELREELRRTAGEHDVVITEQLGDAMTLDRRCSVLFRPSPDTAPAALAAMVAALRDRGCHVASGGDWISVTRGADKGVGLRLLLEALSALDEVPSRVVAVGDADNDVPLMLAAESRFAVRADDGSVHESLRPVPGITPLDPPGTAGWRSLVGLLTSATPS